MRPETLESCSNWITELWNNSARGPVPFILLGKKDWFYLKHKLSTNDYRGLSILTARQLESWKNSIEIRKKNLEERGIRFLFVVAPDKKSIYPEYMPAGLKKVNNRTRLDQLIEYLRNNSSVKNKKSPPHKGAFNAIINYLRNRFCGGTVLMTLSLVPSGFRHFFEYASGFSSGSPCLPWLFLREPVWSVSC